MARKKKLNKRVVILLVAVGTLLGMVTLTLVIYFRPQDPVLLARRAEKMMSASRYDKAVGLYRQAAQAERKPVYLLGMGNAMLKWCETDRSLGQARQSELYRSARAAFLEAVQLDASFEEAHRQVVYMERLGAVYHGNWLRYVTALDGLLKVVPDDEDALFERARAKTVIARSRTDYYQLALEDFRTLLERSPKRDEYWVALASLHYQQELDEETEKTFREGLKANPDSAKLRVAWAEVLRERGRRDEALQFLQEALQRQPEEAEAYLAAARHYRSSLDLEEAVKVLQECVRVAPGDHRAYVELAMILAYSKKQLEQAEAILTQGLDAVKGQGALEEHLAGSRLDKFYMGILKLNHELCDVLLYRLEGGAAREEILPKVQQAMERMRDIREDHPYVIKIQGRLALADGKTVEAEQLLRAAYDQMPTFEPKAANILIKLYRRMGQLGEAEKIIQRYVGSTREDPAAQMALARLCVDYRKYDKAQVIVDEVAKKAPNNSEVVALKLVLDVITGRTNRIPAALKTTDEYAARIFVVHARQMWLEGNQTAAIELLKDVLGRRPQTVAAVFQLIRWHKQRKDTQALDLLYKQATQVYKNDPKILKQLALATETDPDKRFAYELALAEEETDPVRRALQQARVCSQYRKKEQREKFLKQAQQLGPDHPLVIEESFHYALVESDFETAARYVDAAAAADIDKVGGRIYMSRLARARAQWDEAIRLTLEAVRLRPRFSQAHAFLGDCYLATRKFDQAREAYETAYSQNPASVSAIRGLVMVSEATGRSSDYAYWVNVAYKFRPADPNIRERYLQLRRGRDAPQKEIKHREQIARSRPDDLTNLGHLAELYMQIGQLDRAEQIYRLMMEVSNGALQSVSQLVNLLARMDRDAEGRRLLAEYAEKAPDRVGAYILWGTYLEDADEIDKAQKAFEKAGEIDINDGRGLVNLARFKARRGKWPEAAKHQAEYFEKFGEKAYARAEHDLIDYLIQAEEFKQVEEWTARALKKDPSDLAILTLQAKSFLRQREYDRAKNVLDACIRANPGSTEALMYRARVHLAQGHMRLAKNDLEDARRMNAPVAVSMELVGVYEGMDDFSGAYNVLQSMLADRPGYAPALRASVLLCRRYRHWNRLAEVLALARKTYPFNVFYVMAEADMYLEQGQFTRAEGFLALARQAFPNTAALGLKQMEAMVAGERLDEALALGGELRDHPEVGYFIMSVCGTAHFRKGNEDKAADEFRAALKGAKPGGELRFVVNQIQLAYGPKVACEKLKQWLSIRPDDWQLRLIIGDMLTKEKDFDAAVVHLNKGLELTSRDDYRFGLMRALGVAYYEKGNFQESRAAYEAALKLRPKEQMTLNNLAWMLVNDLNQPDEAMRLIRQALDMEPYNPYMLDTYGVVLIAKEQLGEAENVLSRSASFKEMPSNRLHLGQLYEKMDRKQDAMREYLKGWNSPQDRQDDPNRAACRAALKRLGQDPGERSGT